MKSCPSSPSVTLVFFTGVFLVSCSGSDYTPLGWEGLPAFPAGTVAFYGDNRTGHDHDYERTLHDGVLFPSGSAYRAEVWSPGATLVDSFDLTP